MSRRVSEDDLILLRWHRYGIEMACVEGSRRVDPACSGDVERVSAGVSTSWFRDLVRTSVGSVRTLGDRPRDKTTVRLRPKASLHGRPARLCLHSGHVTTRLERVGGVRDDGAGGVHVWEVVAGGGRRAGRSC
jgi:hypothetical protein